MYKWYVGFFKNRDPKKLFAVEIQKIEGLDCNHVEIMKMNLETGETTCYGAVYPVSREINLTELEKTHELKEAIEIFPNSRVECDWVLRGLMGKPYSILQIVLIYLKIRCKVLANYIPYVKLNLTNELVCTELVGEFLIDACDYVLGMSQEVMTIRNIREIVSKYEWRSHVSNTK